MICFWNEDMYLLFIKLYCITLYYVWHCSQLEKLFLTERTGIWLNCYAFCLQFYFPPMFLSTQLWWPLPCLPLHHLTHVSYLLYIFQANSSANVAAPCYHMYTCRLNRSLRLSSCQYIQSWWGSNTRPRDQLRTSCLPIAALPPSPPPTLSVYNKIWVSKSLLF